MGAIGGLTGLAGGANGSGFAGPTTAPIQTGTNNGQLASTYQNAQTAGQSQTQLLQALQGQNGISNQNQVYGQLQGIANGTGPNPAQAQLAQSTGQNVANQAAMMAGQRGAGANAGLIARQAAQQGSNTQQQSAGQAATLQAQQSLNAIGQAGTMAGTQVANQIGATTANTQAQQSEQGIIQGSNTAYNQALVGMQGNINSVNGQLANTNMQGQQGLIGGMMNGASSLMSMGAKGGQVKKPQKFEDGGDVQPGPQSVAPPASQVQAPQSGPQSSFTQFLKGWSGAKSGNTQQPGQAATAQQSSGPNALYQGMSNMTKSAFGQSGAPSGGQGWSGTPQGQQAALNGTYVPQNAMSSSNSTMDTTPSEGAADVGARGGNVGSKLKSGGHVPGKPNVQGNSYQNDTVKALLSPGEVVIPNSVMQSKNPSHGAAKFVEAIMMKKRAGK